jgi:DNA-binding Lrp family transcriptional regulator
MEIATLEKRERGVRLEKHCALLNIAEFASLAPQTLEILSLLSRKEMSIKEISRVLNKSEQSVWYHVNKLKKLGVVKEAFAVSKRGFVEKFYKASIGALAIDLDEMWSSRENEKSLSKSLLLFLNPLVKNGVADFLLVVGSPDPHGSYKVRARDFLPALQLSFFLGNICSFPPQFCYDTEVYNTELIKENLMVVGGVLVNTVTLKLNSYMPVRFSLSSFPFKKIISTKTMREYTDNEIGFICKFPNPFMSEKYVIVFAGVGKEGTYASIVGFVKEHEKILESYDGEDVWYVVVRGIDADSDGRIEEVEVVE